jgi:uncharacterized protein YdcH (DUF465 family)
MAIPMQNIVIRRIYLKVKDANYMRLFKESYVIDVKILAL